MPRAENHDRDTLRVKPMADEAGQLADQEPGGDRDRHQRRREQEEHRHEHELRRHDRPTGDFELDLRRDRVGRDEAEDEQQRRRRRRGSKSDEE